MKNQGRVLVGMMLVGFLTGCSDNYATPAAPPQNIFPHPIPTASAAPEPQMLEVVGSAKFGNQCPYGSYVPPASVPIELWNCPMNVPKAELVEPLPSLILQADCKKKTIDVRSDDRAVPSNTWEVMPDGNFYFTINAGIVHLKTDGAGHTNCAVPMVADMWGKIDCKDRDKATIRVETVWWLGKTLEDLVTQPSPTPSAAPSSPSSPGTPPPPHLSPSPQPSGVPNPAASEAPTPNPTPTPTHTHGTPPHPVIIHSVDDGVIDSQPACKVPNGCYFHNITTIDQCS